MPQNHEGMVCFDSLWLHSLFLMLLSFLLKCRLFFVIGDQRHHLPRYLVPNRHDTQVDQAQKIHYLNFYVLHALLLRLLLSLKLLKRFLLYLIAEICVQLLVKFVPDFVIILDVKLQVVVQLHFVSFLFLLIAFPMYLFLFPPQLNEKSLILYQVLHFYLMSNALVFSLFFLLHHSSYCFLRVMMMTRLNLSSYCSISYYQFFVALCFFLLALVKKYKHPLNFHLME
mmetsp:Transcript_7437/g.11110  ORF Transcript_7437/g.11110 Transcript_7437/m.11110 type:complete len:227 (-) Transcript_7437:208-888(-)